MPATVIRPRRLRTAAAIAGVAVLIAAEGYAATHTTGPGPQPSGLAPVPSAGVPLPADVFENPLARRRENAERSAAARAQLDETVRSLYGAGADRQSR